MLREILSGVRSGKISVEKAAKALSGFPSEDLKFANIDFSRRARCGLPEAVYCEGKTPAQIGLIARRMMDRDGFALLTRLPEAVYRRVKRTLPGLKYNKLGRVAYCSKRSRPRPAAGDRTVLIITAGTSDIPVAEEAKATLSALGSRVRTIYDVGVAGMHRLLSRAGEIRSADVIIVVAGMEGALASAVAGLASSPVISVPTSCGYGAGFSGLAPLLTMLNSCAPGVSVVNIDNGFGAAYAANMIITRSRQ